MPFLNAAGVDVHYVEHGPPAGEATNTAVLLHGFTADHRIRTGCFEPVFEDRRGWRRVFLDLPGMGRSVALQSISSTGDVFAVVRAAVRKLAPKGRSSLCVESSGRYLARGLVAAAPEPVGGLALVYLIVLAELARRDADENVVLVRDAFAATAPACREFDEAAAVQ